MIDGARAGEQVIQKECPFGDGSGYEFRDLPPHAHTTIRASADGYRSVEVRTLVTNGGPPLTFVLGKS